MLFLVAARDRIGRTLAVIAVTLGLLAGSIGPAAAAGGSNGNLRGTVTDATTKKPLAGAKIAIVSPSGTYSTTTDSAGHFSVNGLVVDTYVVSIQAPGYDLFAESGVTVLGDQTVDLGTIPISKLKTIGTVQARNPSAAFQPGQTTDSFTIGAARQEEVFGKAEAINENQLLLSVPGTSTTDSGRVTIGKVHGRV
jgi:type 1 fimbria pilin